MGTVTDIRPAPQTTKTMGDENVLRDNSLIDAIKNEEQKRIQEQALDSLYALGGGLPAYSRVGDVITRVTTRYRDVESSHFGSIAVQSGIDITSLSCKTGKLVDIYTDTSGGESGIPSSFREYTLSPAQMTEEMDPMGGLFLEYCKDR